MDDGRVATCAGFDRTGAKEAAPRAAHVLQLLRDNVATIQLRAQRFDGDSAFPAADMSLLRDIGALHTFGADGATAGELMEVLRLLGRANLSVGRIFEGHVNGAALIRWYGNSTQRFELEGALAAGLIFGVWNTEPPPGVRVDEANGPKPSLTGFKSFTTGAGAIDRAIITARLPTGGSSMIIVDASDPRRTDPTAWRVRGMRATVSGTYDLTGLPADASVRLGKPDDYGREPRFSAGAWRFTAVQLGGIERVLGLLRNHLVAGPLGVDSVHRARFGEALAATRSAYLWVRDAATRVEVPDADLDVVPFVLLTRGVVERAGLQVMEAAARSVGTRSFFEDDPLDQACRDLAMYLRQPSPDQALDWAAAAFLERDRWSEDPLW